MREKEKDSQSFCAKLAVMISVLMLILVMIATGSKIVYAADNAKATTNNDSGDTVTSPKVWQENAGHMRIIPCRH